MKEKYRSCRITKQSTPKKITLPNHACSLTTYLQKVSSLISFFFINYFLVYELKCLLVEAYVRTNTVLAHIVTLQIVPSTQVQFGRIKAENASTDNCVCPLIFFSKNRTNLFSC